MARGGRVTALALVAALLTLLPAAPTPAAPDHVRAELRANQQGWLRHETKLATLMASAPLGHTTFTVLDRHRRVVLHGTVPRTPVGGWSGRFPAGYALDLSALHAKGRYVVRTQGAVTVGSPPFRIATAQELFAPMVRYGAAFDQAQRDGDDQVAAALHRQPSHLNDAQAG